MRPIQGADLGNSKYRILSINSCREDENKHIGDKEIVQCEWKKNSNGLRLVVLGKDER